MMLHSNKVLTSAVERESFMGDSAPRQRNLQDTNMSLSPDIWQLKSKGNDSFYLNTGFQ